MPDPLSHHTDMITHKPNEMPTLWWLNPWAYARNLKQALHAVDLLTETTEDAYQAAKVVIKQKEELADYHQNERNAFLRKVELTLKPVFSNCDYEDTLDLVGFAAEEIKDRRAQKIRDDAELLEAKNLVLKLLDEREKYEKDLTKAEARVKQVTMFCENAGAERDREKQRVEQITLMVNDRDKQIDIRDKEVTRLLNLTRNLKRKLSKAEKAKPLWEDKTAVSFTAGNHEDSPGMTRKERIAWLNSPYHLGPIKDPQTFRHGIQPKAKKAKKKGGRRG